MVHKLLRIGSRAFEIVFIGLVSSELKSSTLTPWMSYPQPGRLIHFDFVSRVMLKNSDRQINASIRVLNVGSQKCDNNKILAEICRRKVWSQTNITTNTVSRIFRSETLSHNVLISRADLNTELIWTNMPFTHSFNPDRCSFNSLVDNWERIQCTVFRYRTRTFSNQCPNTNADFRSVCHDNLEVLSHGNVSLKVLYCNV